MRHATPDVRSGAPYGPRHQAPTVVLRTIHTARALLSIWSVQSWTRASTCANRSPTSSAPITPKPSHPRRSSPARARSLSRARSSTTDELRLLVDASLDFWLTTGRFAERIPEAVRASTSVSVTRCCATRGSSANLLAVSALTSRAARRAPAAARRRGDHGGRRLPDHGQPDPPEPARPGLPRCRAAAPTTSSSTISPRPSARERKAVIHRAHARQPVRPRRDPALSAKNTASGCSRTTATRSERRTTVSHAALRRPRDGELLPRAPHHDGRRRRRDGEAPDAQEDRRELPRLGPRLLVRDRARKTHAASASTGSWASFPYGYDHKYIY